MEKKIKAKMPGISLIVTGCLLISSVSVVLVTWKIVFLIIGVGGGCYLIQLGLEHLKQSDQPVDEIKKPKES